MVRILKCLTVAMIAALVVINLLGYAAGFGGGFLLRLPEKMRRALTLEVGMQNAGLGTVLVLDLFPDTPEAAIPTAATSRRPSTSMPPGRRSRPMRPMSRPSPWPAISRSATRPMNGPCAI